MFARTQRLLLRPAWQEDVEPLYRAIADERVVRNLSRAPWPYTRENAAVFVGAERSAREASFLIFKIGGPALELIGAIGLGATRDGAAELGYWLAPAHWGQGYAPEAGRAVVAIARDALRLRRLLAGHFLDNPASGAVLRKLGFKPTGLIRTRPSVARGEDVASAEFELDLAPGTIHAAAPALAA
jgi:RimJ/RimL family protein N-acetyltransferase